MAAYCVRCRARRQMQASRPVVLRNTKRPTRATKGTCPECRGTMYRIEK
jgi:hypothetical protein